MMTIKPMTSIKQGSLARRFGTLLVPLGILVLLLGGVAANSGLRQMLAQAVERIDPWAVVAVLPVQLCAILVCTAAAQALRPGVSFYANFVARLVRDAGHNLLIFPPGLGDAIGVRALVLAGGRARAAVSLRVLDVAAEVIAEIPYMVLAFVVLWGFWGRTHFPQVSLPGWGWPLGLVVVLGLGLAARGWLRANAKTSRAARHLRIEWHLLKRELQRQKVGMPLAVFLHFIAWGLSGLQVWLAAQVFGLHLSLFGALAIESAATSARVILFLVPGGLVMQEAGAVLAGAAVGVAAPTALALSLVLRLRDVVFGVALLWWPVMEYRHRRAAA